MPEGQKVSRYETYQQATKQGAIIPELDGPELPPEASELWEAFCCMGTVSASEIESYVNITGIDLSVWEVKALFLLERLR